MDFQKKKRKEKKGKENRGVATSLPLEGGR
jgi:hypothetical protein